MKKQLLFVIAALVVSMLCSCMKKDSTVNPGEPDDPQPIVKGEPCGKNLYWIYDEQTFTLDITGEGAMFDFDTIGPWSYIEEWGDPHIFEIKEIHLPEGITHIGSRAFREAAVTDIVIPNSVKTIGDRAFESSDLENIIIGEGCTNIGDYAFGSYEIKRVICYAAIPPALGSYTFYYRGGTPSYSIYVPSRSVDAYKSDSRWGEYNIVALP